MRSTAANDRRDDSSSGKLSAAFSARLSRLKPKDKVRAVLLIRTPEAEGKFSDSRPSSEERRVAAEQVLNSASAALPDLDEILGRFSGHRLSERPSALGTVAIESTPAGITALAESDHVKAILEDQPISLVR